MTLAGRNLSMLWTAEQGWNTSRDGEIYVDVANQHVWDPEIRAVGLAVERLPDDHAADRELRRHVPTHLLIPDRGDIESCHSDLLIGRRRSLRYVGVSGERAIAFALVGTPRATACSTSTIPGACRPNPSSDPALAPALAAAAMQTLQCGVIQYAATAGMLTGEYLTANGFVDNHPWEWRGVVEIKGAPGSCNYGRGTTAMGFYTPLQQARFQLDDAFNRLDKFTDARGAEPCVVDGRRCARTPAMPYLLLGEGMCEMTIDNGPKMTRAEVFAVAEERFTDAITRATARQ